MHFLWVGCRMMGREVCVWGGGGGGSYNVVLLGVTMIELGTQHNIISYIINTISTL